MTLSPSEKAGKLESMQKLLDRKIQQSRELKEKLDDELKFMKEEGVVSLTLQQRAKL